MTVEEAQTRKDKILAEARKEKPFPDHPRVSYQVLKQLKYVDSPDSFASPPSDSDDTPEEIEARKKRYSDASFQNQIITPYHFKIKVNEMGLPCTSQSETEIETEEDEEVQASQDKFLAGTNNDSFSQIFLF
ncbi:hypothetical protein POM88_020197 [Heracleum sosnowskyi]|uniref:Uncharacterized protein n=1 Tax=Heracleum sosnowskyi TaxID=360622 RepID=A0AAD8IAY0_9APIA|nr:hypothetical protein POM88_020197 [Heracleum sosnowskyi]